MSDGRDWLEHAVAPSVPHVMVAQTAPPQNPPTPISPAQPWRARLVLCALLAGFTLTLCESVLRLFWHPVATVNVETYGPHPDYGFAPIPGASGHFARTEYSIEFRNTRQRLRGSKILTAERAPGTRARVLFLGDSFTYGISCEEAETFIARLQTQWPDCELINAGCTGYGPREELAVLDRLGGALQPEVTVLEFFWNDLEDVLRPIPIYTLDSQGHVRRTVPDTTPTDPLKLWPEQLVSPRPRWRTCYVYELLREATAAFRHRWLAHGGAPGRLITTPAQMENSWRLLEEQYRLLKTRADEIGTHLVVVGIPDYNIVNPEAVVASLKPLNFQVDDRIAKVCADAGIDYVSALPAMRAAFAEKGGAAGAKRDPLYYAVDRHCTPEGNRVLASVLADKLAPLLPKR